MLASLISEKPYEQIVVKEVLDRANVIQPHRAPAFDGCFMKRTDEQILDAYRDGYTLKCIPSKLSKKMIVLRWLVERFEPGTRYPDFATLRRELYDAHLLERRDGIYWREP